MIGETFGSYKITGKIGEGGMGAVYLAEHALLGRKAAVKVLLPEHSRSQDLIDRFFNEAKTAAGLNHPALVDVFDFGVHPSGSAYLVMDYLEGESLGARLARLGPMPGEVVIDLGRQIARGMEVAHRGGIVHRDLKPENIFLVPDADEPGHEQVKIIDFGIAKLLGLDKTRRGATSTGMVLGTPLYMAPEQCKGSGVVDHRADIYSVGCILYAMLCGRPPFEFPGVGEILAAHLYQPVTPPRTINPAVDPALEALVMKALSKNPDERQQTMAALASELGRLGGHQSQAARPPSATTFSGAAPPPPAPVPRRRLMVPVAIAFAAGLALSVFALLRPRTGPLPTPVVVTPPIVVARLDAAGAMRVSDAASAAVVARSPVDAAAVALEAETQEGKERTPEPKPRRAALDRKAEPRGREPMEAYSRGITHLARGEEGEALLAFRAYLRGDTLNPARRSEAERYLIDLQRKFGEIEVACDFPGALVQVDGRTLGRTPLSSSVVLPVGVHELAVTKEGYRPIRKSFRINGGDRQPFFFRLAH
jgi:hypothetical protein